MARRPKRPPRSPRRQGGPGKQLIAPIGDALDGRPAVPDPRAAKKKKRPPASGKPGSLPAVQRLELRDDLLPPRADWERLVPVAKLGKTWGVHGHNSVRLYNADSELPWAADVMLLRGEAFPLAAVEVDEWKIKGSRILIRFVGIRSPQLAKQLVNLELLCHPDELPAVEDEDEIYVHELLGMTVIDTERGELGAVVDVMSTGSNDVWVVRGAPGETLIPAVKDFVLEIDRAARVIRVKYELI